MRYIGPYLIGKGVNFPIFIQTKTEIRKMQCALVIENKSKKSVYKRL